MVFEVPEHALDPVSVPVSAEVAWDGLASIGLRRDDRENTAHQQARADGVAVIPLVGEQGFGLGDRKDHERVDRLIVRGLATGQDEAERASLIVAAGVDLACKAAA